ncbi:MAG: hypothetical protein B6U88_00175 [Candidatus Aenigmarchaeota archaeon ex4484_56]|nr:MAG: hypothetical protein B6U88_00175 [Candidatus Aenigmarchaeota archaeon ex4484_56]
MKIYWILPIILIILLSGCIEEGMPFYKYAEAIGVVENKQTVEPPDVIVVTDYKIFPSDRVAPDSSIEVMVYIKNKDERKSVNVNYIGISNPGIFECVICEDENINLNPLEEKSFIFKLNSPGEEEIGTMAIMQSLGLTLKYSYTSYSSTTLNFINEDTAREFMKSKGKIPITISTSMSRGPVRLEFDISHLQQPLIANGKTFQVYLRIYNEGDGVVNSIKQNNLNINFNGLSVDSYPEEYFECSSECENDKSILLFGDISPKYYFSVNGPSSIDSGLVKTYTLRANAEYAYEVYKQIPVTVSPRAQI